MPYVANDDGEIQTRIQIPQRINGNLCNACSARMQTGGAIAVRLQFGKVASPLQEREQFFLHFRCRKSELYSVPKEIIEEISIVIVDFFRRAGIEFERVRICPTGDPHPLWKDEPYNELIDDELDS